MSNFDLGLDSLLRAPLDVINLQIDSIDVLNHRLFLSLFSLSLSLFLPLLGAPLDVINLQRDSIIVLND